MRKNITSLLTLLFAFFLTAQASGASVKMETSEHFIADDGYRTKVENAFKKKIDLVGKQFYDQKMLKKQKVASDEAEALRFLYAYMPLADVTDYPTAFFLQNVRTSFEARKEMSWGKNVPELLFRHFVLPIRVNNENLDDSRQVFYQELKERVRGMSMKDAILEVNHWCHERVTYQPSDGRTSAPLATIRSAYGRCGEESTFTVAALRAIGIPARQVYTPRWAHTDDNHAWVEAWADGKWYFLGACEPEAVLNLAWFNAPASRAMLMHTKAFGDYNGPEEVMLRTSNYTEINLIDNYGSSARIDFSVVDEQGQPVDGARVDFKIYNYAEFCSVVTKYTGADGKTFLSAGKGDMMVWASKKGKYGFAKASFGTDQKIVIRLSHEVATAQASAQGAFYRDSFDIIPPVERANVPFVSPAEREKNLQRFAYEDSIRHAYLATFYTKQTALQALMDQGLAVGAEAADNGLSPNTQKMVDFLVASSGNHAVILDFLVRHKSNLDRAIALLGTLSAKDLRDMQMGILEDNFNAESDQLSPRVENEMIISPFKQFFEKAFESKSLAFKNNPALLVKWVGENIRINPDKKALQIAQTPIGVWKSRLTDERSRKVFFVDVARSLGIEAQVDAVTKKTQYKQDGEWIDVEFDSPEAMAAKGNDVAEMKDVKASPKGILKLEYQDNGMVDDPKYYSHFSLTRINPDGSTSLLEYPEEGITWSNTFKNGVELDEGDYALVSGTRLANGGVLSEMQMFHVKHHETTVVGMYLRTSSTEVTVIGNFDSESKFKLLDAKQMMGVSDVDSDGKAGQEVSLLSQTGRGYFITGLIGVGQEPTNHALKDIAKVSGVFEKWNRPIVLLFEDEASAAKFRISEFPGLPKNIIFGIDKNGAIRRQIVENMKLTNATQLPIFTISDTFNRMVFISQGYTIGLGEQLETVIKKL